MTWDLAPKQQAIKGRIDNWDYIKLKNFCVTTE